MNAYTYQDSDPLSVQLVEAVVIEPNVLIKMAFDDPNVSSEDFNALVQSIYGQTAEDL
jgi:hypothetical protein